MSQTIKVFIRYSYSHLIPSQWKFPFPYTLFFPSAVYLRALEPVKLKARFNMSPAEVLIELDHDPMLV